MAKLRLCAATATLALLIVPSTYPVAAAEPVAADQAPAATVPAATVPLTKVVMFSSGVGFFDRQGEVAGDAAVALKFNASDIDDLLKSLVVEDRGGGQISAVTYASKDPITKTLKKFAVDLTDNPTLGDILNQIRGERIEFSAPAAMTGTLLGVETRQRQIGANHETIQVEIMNVLTDDGLRSVPLEQVGAIKLVNAQLNKEFRQALAVLALGHDADKKSVTLHFAGKGKRPVRVGYIQNMPIWKTSYRLVLADDAKPMLQGWAIVENTTEEDWNAVHLTLVSGRPVSFVMNLYDPLYVQRPRVEPELFAGLRPQVYGQDLDANGFVKGRLGEFPHFTSDLAIPMAKSGLPTGMAAAAPGQGTMGGMGGGSGPAYETKQKDIAYTIAKPLDDYEGNGGDAGLLFNGVKSAAATGDVGELFKYTIVPPVTLARQESAMLPIVDDHVGGKKLSVYNPAVQAKHPLSGLRLTNTTDLHLMQGPITVFDGGVYAGDARIEDVAPGGERLLTYALDLDVECNSEHAATPEEIASIRISKGVLHAQHKLVRTQKYKVKNSDPKAKTILIEQPLASDWKLISPKEPTEKTRALYRFAVEAEPGKTAELEVVEEHQVSQQIMIANADDATIQFFQRQRAISPEVKAALEKTVAMKTAIAGLVEQRTQLEQQLKSITEEQQRIRQNMMQLDRNSDLYKRYVKKFGDQEDAVEKLGLQIKDLIQNESKQRKALEEYLLALDLK